MSPSPEERRALALYVVADRDFTDFLDMLEEPETTLASLDVLRKMCTHPNPREDAALWAELNALMVPFIDRTIARLRS